MQILGARKAYFMHTKLKVLASGTLREKIARFIFWGMDSEGKLQLDYTRETWASYFSVARPSLSREQKEEERKKKKAPEEKEEREREAEVLIL